MVRFRIRDGEIWKNNTIDWDNGEFIDNCIKKKKLILLKNGKEVDLTEEMNDVRQTLKEYKESRFEDLDKTLLPLARFATTHPIELVGFLLGFIAGGKFEREDIQIKTIDVEPTQEEIDQFNSIKLESYDFGVDSYE